MIRQKGKNGLGGIFLMLLACTGLQKRLYAQFEIMQQITLSEMVPYSVQEESEAEVFLGGFRTTDQKGMICRYDLKNNKMVYYTLLNGRSRSKLIQLTEDLKSGQLGFVGIVSRSFKKKYGVVGIYNKYLNTIHRYTFMDSRSSFYGATVVGSNLLVHGWKEAKEGIKKSFTVEYNTEYNSLTNPQEWNDEAGNEEKINGVLFDAKENLVFMVKTKAGKKKTYHGTISYFQPPDNLRQYTYNGTDRSEILKMEKSKEGFIAVGYGKERNGKSIKGLILKFGYRLGTLYLDGSREIITENTNLYILNVIPVKYDDGFMVCGYLHDKVSGKENAYAAKFNRNLEKEWEFRETKHPISRFYDIKILKNMSILLCGYANNQQDEKTIKGMLVQLYENKVNSYLSIVKRADDLYNKASYTKAYTEYNMALKALPEMEYPKLMMSKIEKMEREAEEKRRKEEELAKLKVQRMADSVKMVKEKEEYERKAYENSQPEMPKEKEQEKIIKSYTETMNKTKVKKNKQTKSNTGKKENKTENKSGKMKKMSDIIREE